MARCIPRIRVADDRVDQNGPLQHSVAEIHTTKRCPNQRGASKVATLQFAPIRFALARSTATSRNWDRSALINWALDSGRGQFSATAGTPARD